jgi:hypothetical protein
MSSQSLNGGVSLGVFTSFERGTDGAWSGLIGTDMHTITGLATGPDGSRYVASWDVSADQGYVLKEVSGVWTTVGSSSFAGSCGRK